MESHETISIDDIMSVFREFDGIYQKEMVDAAIERREEIIPRLIAVLEQVTADPDEYIKDTDLYDHLYALMLLGYFKATEAHDTIIRLFSLPDKAPHDLFGEITTNNLPSILLRTCGGSIERIKALALNREADDYCRISALQALTFAVGEGVAAREEVVAFLGGLFTGEETGEESDFWSFAADFAIALYPEENSAVIEKAFAEGLLSTGIVDHEQYTQAMQAGKEQMLAQLKAQYAHYNLDDVHASMSWWACFNEDNELTAASDPLDLIASDLYGKADAPHAKNNDKAKKKKKRKQAKTAKRKNRR
ncbi:MAG: DUF1186 domain-containing protein [Desulfatitalea sp.]